MFGFIKKEAEELGSVGRFYKRIEKFRNRNELKREFYKTQLGLRKHILECIAKGEPTGTSVKGWDEKFLKDTENLKKPIIWIHPVIEHHFWWILHNNIAHLLIGLIPIKLFFDFHDWTSRKLNAS